MLIITALLYSAIYNKGGTREGARLMKGMLSPTKGYKLIVLPPAPITFYRTITSCSFNSSLSRTSLRSGKNTDSRYDGDIHLCHTEGNFISWNKPRVVLTQLGRILQPASGCTSLPPAHTRRFPAAPVDPAMPAMYHRGCTSRALSIFWRSSQE